MIFSLIHPSRGRARQAYDTMNRWIAKSVYKDIQYIFSLDNDDRQLNFYRSFLSRAVGNITPEIVIDNNRNLVQAIQKVKPEMINGQIIIVVSDDFDCPQDWDKELLSAIDDREEFAIKVNDGISKSDNPIMMLPILSKKLFDRLGYIYYPEYIGMYADNDLFEVCDKLGAMIHAPHLLFQHNHWINGKSRKDETHQRHDNPLSWSLGKKILAERRQRNFDIK